MNQPPEEDAVDRVLNWYEMSEIEQKRGLIFYTQIAKNVPSERKQSDPRSNPAKPFVAKSFHANDRRRLE
jgi:hypothetical protein